MALQQQSSGGRSEGVTGSVSAAPCGRTPSINKNKLLLKWKDVDTRCQRRSHVSEGIVDNNF